MTLRQLKYLLPVIGRLGLKNIATVMFYRMMLKTGAFVKLMPVGQSYEDQPFGKSVPQDQPEVTSLSNGIAPEIADNLCAGLFRYFSCHEFQVGTPPRWFANPFNERTLNDTAQHWSRIADFTSGIGDIKVVWELSRFAWAPDLTRAYVATGDEKYLNCLNRWVSSWVENNPLNTGPNWKCGQEAGIRMLHLLLAAYLLEQHKKPSAGLVRFVSEHCGRIEPTIYYALAQNNNHGTSEAAALYVGGLWLSVVTDSPEMQAKALRWKDKGKRLLIDRVKCLISEDGTFSQNSTIYHRLLLDTLCLVEFWRRELLDDDFPLTYYKKCRAAVDWLTCMIDASTGDAPNLGANDGSSLFRLHDCDYRDFRPIVQLGSVLFCSVRLYDAGPWDDQLKWMHLDSAKDMHAHQVVASRQFSDGGYVVFRPGQKWPARSWGVLRYPKYRFRPGHADGMNLDLWHRGVYLFRDSGSYSYNNDGPWTGYFGATRAHNTIELDGRDQMPKISRFLRGAWLTMRSMEDLQVVNGQAKWSGTYEDYAKGAHKRTVECNAGLWKITDYVEGTNKNAVLRWRLAPINWQLEENSCVSELAELRVEASVPINRSELTKGRESLYYMQHSALPVWEIDIGPGPAYLTTYVTLK